MSRAVWIDAGNDPDYAKLKAHGIDVAYFDPRDPRVTTSYLAGVLLKGLEVGIYAAWNWWPDLTGAEFAGAVSAYVTKIGNDNPTLPRVMLDCESHAVAGYILPMLKRWREMRPKRVTDWTLEGFQGGLFWPNDVLRIAAANVGVYPSTYAGDMTPFDTVAVFRDLVANQFPPARVGIMYDAAHLPPEWSGFAFTQGRLP